MRGKRVKQLRKELVKIMPGLRKQYGKRLRPFKSIFRQVKKKYIEAGKVVFN